MRRTPRALLAACGAVCLLAACGDDDDEGGATTTSNRISTEGVCEVLDADHVSQVMGVEFDEALSGDASCTYTSSTSETAFTLQVTDRGTNDAALVLETMGGSCDPDTREDRTFSRADGGFSCLAGGVPNVVAAGSGVVLVLTGNSREPGVSPQMVVEDLVTILEDAIVTFAES
jgi:nitrous oxide reductase accessory protein NosL